MSAQKFRVVDLEEKLCADSDGVLRNEINDQLSSARAEVKRVMDSGLPPGDYERAQQIHGGIERAEAVVNDVWDAVNK